MNRLRTGLAGLGVTALVVGVGTVLAPETAAAASSAAVALLGTDYTVVAVVGLVAGGLAAVVGLQRTRDGLEQSNPPAPEGYPTAPSPGSSVNGLLERRRIGQSSTPLAEANRLRARLREAAVAVVMREERCSRQRASARVDAGTWTGDTLVAAFLCESATGPGRPLADGGQQERTRFREATRRAAVEIIERTGETDRA